jgi:hypothetical protein
MNGANASTETTEVAWGTRRDAAVPNVARQCSTPSVPRIHQSHWAVLLMQHFNGKTALPADRILGTDTPSPGLRRLTPF